MCKKLVEVIIILTRTQCDESVCPYGESCRNPGRDRAADKLLYFNANLWRKLRKLAPIEAAEVWRFMAIFIPLPFA